MVLINILSFYVFYNIAIIKFLFILTRNNHQLSITTLNFFYLVNDRFFLNYLLVLLLNISGVPPFIGFFLKISLLSFLNNSFFIFLFFYFFIFLFLSLWFYLKNVKFLLLDGHTLFSKSLPPHNLLLRGSDATLTLFFYIFFLLGFLFLDDYLIFTFFLFNV